MKWIKSIETEFPKLSFNETSRSIIQTYRDKGHTRHPCTGKHATTYHRLQQQLAAQCVKHQNKGKAQETIVGPKQEGDSQQSQKPHSPLQGICLPISKATKAHVSPKQRKEHILTRIMPTAPMNQIPRNFGQQGEQQQVSSILETVSSINKTFHNQKSKDRKSQSSECPHQKIGCHFTASHSTDYLQKRFIAPAYKHSHMVYQHGYYCQQF